MWGCHAGGPDGSPNSTGTDPIDELPGDAADTGEGGDTGEPPDDYDFLFGLDRVHTIDITLSDGSKRALARAPKEYVEGGATIDGETFGRVGVRLKGSGAFYDLSGKAAFKIDLNRFDPDQSFHGKGKLTLNNMTHDETQVHEVVAYAAFAAAGLPAARVGYAWVTVNGATCQRDEGCRAHFAAGSDQVLADLDAAGLEALMDEAAALTRPYVEDDPRNFIDERNLDASIEVMRAWIRDRSEAVGNWY